MKKILIASSCAIMLCFTSCASKQAPETDSQVEAPETETSETEAAASEENNQIDDAENTSEDEQTAEDFDKSEEDTPLSSEDFPEPEIIEEPEIITLEPVEEPEPSEEEPASEEVEKEEPPEITLVNSNEENQAENPDETNAANETTSAEDNEVEDISANDVVIVSNQDSDGISGGIDITDDDSDSDVNLSDIEKDITPSRSVTLKKFEYLDITYPGTGWIYMGLTDNSKDLAYFGRKLGTKDTKFSLQARASGKKIVHFYRNDPLTGQYLDDYIEVIITAENGSNKTHVEAPEYKLPVQKKEKPVNKVEEKEEIENEPEEKAQEPKKDTASAKTNETSKGADSAASKKTSETVKKTDSAKKEENEKPVNTNKTSAPVETKTENVNASSANTSDPATLLQEAQLLYNEKEYSASLKKLNQFFEYSTDKGDEALYLKGQILEAKSDIRDIKGAIDAYTTLTKNYPASKLWDSANKRIIYLKRFYLEVR